MARTQPRGNEPLSSHIIERRRRAAAVSADDRCDPLRQAVLRLRVGNNTPVRVRMNVKETRRYSPAACIDHARVLRRRPTGTDGLRPSGDGGYAPARHADITAETRKAGTVNHCAVTDNKIKQKGYPREGAARLCFHAGLRCPANEKVGCGGRIPYRACRPRQGNCLLGQEYGSGQPN